MSMSARVEQKRLVTMLVAFVACICLCVCVPSQAQAGELQTGTAKDLTVQAAPAKASTQAKKKAKVIPIKTAKQWRNISKYNGGTFKIMKNISLPSEKYYLTITKNKKYTIDLNGKKIVTAYKSVPLRTVCPLAIKKGTVVLKDSSKKQNGVLYSRETAAVTAEGSSKFYMQSGWVVDDAVEFRSDITSAVMLFGKAQCKIQYKSKIRSIGNGIAMFGSSKLWVTGASYIRAGYNTYRGQFMHYGSALSIASKNARVSLKGGSFGTMASPDSTLWSPAVSMEYTMSGNYPILDQYGKALGTAKGYKYINAKGKRVYITKPGVFGSYYNGVNAPDLDALLQKQFGFGSPKRLTTTVKSADGYYTIYVRKA